MLSWVLLFSLASLGTEQAGHPLQSHMLKLGKPLGKGQAAALGAWSILRSVWALGTGTATFPPCRHPSLCHPAWQKGMHGCPRAFISGPRAMASKFILSLVPDHQGLEGASLLC